MVLESLIKVLENNGIDPNFWVSREYMEKAGITISVDSGWISAWDGDIRMFPPVHHLYGVAWTIPPGGCWSDFSDYRPKTGNATPLDLEYLYDPKELVAMEGSKFRTWRHNHKKWIRRQDIGCARLVDFPDYTSKEVIEGLLIKWLESKEGVDIHDDEILYKYITGGENRQILFHSTKGVVGINAWDENHKYINYRFMICDPDEPFLDEYMRFLFYSHITHKNKLVNDGGVLDSPGLKQFKDRLNPARVRQVRSWKEQVDV